MIVLIDSGVLGILVNPNKVGETSDCEQWLYSLLSQGVYICSSDLCDYEVRRSLILETKHKPHLQSLENLNDLREIIDFLPVSSSLLIQASSLWASARSQGIPTADNKSLDIDIIICSQWQELKQEFPGRYVVIATTNVKHLSRFAEAHTWRNVMC
ncbi:MAG: type II toxin-antitoxin system VapC family toxin [Nodularia sp. CChRGM 3473]